MRCIEVASNKVLSRQLSSSVPNPTLCVEAGQPWPTLYHQKDLTLTHPAPQNNQPYLTLAHPTHKIFQPYPTLPQKNSPITCPKSKNSEVQASLIA